MDDNSKEIGDILQRIFEYTINLPKVKAKLYKFKMDLICYGKAERPVFTAEDFEDEPSDK